MMNRSLPIAITAALFIAACSGDSSGTDPDAAAQSRNSTAAASTAVASQQATTSPSQTAVDSSTTTIEPATTTTEQATTTTAEPTTTTTTTTIPPLEPFELTGTGSDVIALDSLVESAGSAFISHDGESGFVVLLLDAQGDRVEGLVDAVGLYDGVVAVNLDGQDDFAFIQVDADGAWSFRFADLEDIATVGTAVGSSYSSSSDDLVQFVTNEPVIVAFTCDTCEELFEVVVWRTNGERDTLVSIEGSYDARRVVPAGAVLLEIRALSTQGLSPWSMSVEE